MIACVEVACREARLHGARDPRHCEKVVGQTVRKRERERDTSGRKKRYPALLDDWRVAKT